MFGYNWNWSNGKLNFCLIKKKKKVSLGKMWYAVANYVHSFVLTLSISVAVFLAYFILQRKIV